MRRIFNKRLFFLLMTVHLIAFVAQAQLSHFLYLQTDNKQPFYIKYNNKIISSTTSGYIILSKLNDGVINFSLGFPQSNELEQKFAITIDKREKGYLIKNFAEKGRGLYDLQSAVITYAQTNQTPSTSNATTTSTTLPANDPFANMLSIVTQDSTVKNVIVKKEEKSVVVDAPNPQLAITKVDSSKKKEMLVVQLQEPNKQDPVVQAQKVDTLQTVEPTVQQSFNQEVVWLTPSKTPVQRIRRFDSKEGSDLVFEVNESNGVRDTIRLFIAADSLVADNKPTAAIVPIATEQAQDSVEVTPLPQSDLQIIAEIKKEKHKEDTFHVQKDVPKVEVKTEPAGKPSIIPNSNCKQEAAEDDFLKLRKRMAAQNKEEGMVIEAKKIFKTKCFSTAQIKNLAVLFLTDEWRYRFYDAALPFVSDFEAFNSLGATISDEYYKKRFQALLPNQ